MYQKRFMIVFALCMFCFLQIISEASFAASINANDFRKKSTLYIFDDGSWVYNASCSPIKARPKYNINLDFHCWGKDVLTTYPVMTALMWEKSEKGSRNIIADKITIQVAGNAYEYQLIESDPPWESDIRAGLTFLLPSDADLIRDLAFAKECILVAEAENNTFTWTVTGDDYEERFLPFVQDMYKYDFLHNVENNDTNDIALHHSPSRTVYKNIGSKSTVYDSGPEPENGYSFSEDSAAIKEIQKSVFYVEMYDEQSNCLGNASGFVAFDEHYFVTNEHVVDGISYLIIWDVENNSYILDKVVAIDKDHDIALLEFALGDQYTSLKLDINSELKRGMPIVAIGSKGLDVAFSKGVISAFPVLEQYARAKCVQYSAATSLESNGGCLLGENGKVIGVTSAISSEGQYIGVAVPASYVTELYSKLKSNIYNVTDSSGSDNSATLEEKGKKKEDPTIITGGKINTIVAIPRDLDLDPFIRDKMDITVQEFLNKYEEIRRTKVKNAPAINKKIEKIDSSGGYWINCEPDVGVGTRLLWKIEKGTDPNNLNVPLEVIVQYYRMNFRDSRLKENTRACLAAFSGDIHLMDKMIDFYEKNECKYNDEIAGVVTSDGYLITYFSNYADAIFHINYVAY